MGHPFDTIKVHMQTQDAKNPQYRGVIHCMKSITAKESFRGLYRGMSSPMAGVAVINSIVFGVYGNVQRYSTSPNSYTTHFLAGSTAGLAQSLICSPIELAKTRLQLQMDVIGAQKFKGPVQCLSYIYQCEGIRGLFKGLNATALRDIPGFALYFVSYEYLIRLKKDAGIMYTLFAGGTAGMCSWLFTIPIDVAKSRLQADGMNNQRLMYNGISDCIRKSYQNEGFAFLTRGLTSTLLRAFPMNAVCFLVVSTTLKYFDGDNTSMHSKQKVQINKSADNYVNHKRKIAHGFRCVDTFTDAISMSEIVDLTNDWFDNNNTTHKINFSNNLINSHSNNEYHFQFNLQPHVDKNISTLNE